jgi:L-methionine (R)-S-oxide reductase
MTEPDYAGLRARIFSLCAGEADPIANMATMTCELFHSDARFDWVGFYRNIGNRTLKVGPYQGEHGCLTIPFSKGVCGAVARSQKTLIVANVNDFADHIACSSSTQSEIVLPVFDAKGRMIAVLDIDSNLPDAFTHKDQAALEDILVSVFGGHGAG